MAKKQKSKKEKAEVQEIEAGDGQDESLAPRPVNVARITLESDESEKREYAQKRETMWAIIFYVSVLLFFLFLIVILLVDKGVIESTTCFPTSLLKTAMMR